MTNAVKRLAFHRVSEFPAGTIYRLLCDAYGYDGRWQAECDASWRECDSFFVGSPHIADACAFITALDGAAIGLVVWDPRKLPALVEIGHNCIASAYKGRGYGHEQLEEAVRRIRASGAQRILVTTNEALVPAQRNYESVGFRLVGRRRHDNPGFPGDYLDYELV